MLDVVRDYRWGRVEETIGRGPVPGRDARRRLRARAAERRRHRHPQALRRLLGLPRRPQPRPGLDGPARAARRDPAAVRDGRRAGRRRLGDELLLRRRRRARPAPTRGCSPRCCADEWGFTGTVVSDYWAVPFLATMHRVAADTDGRRRAGARRRASTSSCPTRSASAPGWSSGSARGELPEALVDRAARRLLTQKVRARPARPGLDAGGLGGRARPAPTSTRRPTGRWPGSWPSGPSCCSTPARALPLLGDGRPALRRVAVVGPCADDPRTFMGCYAFPNHVLPRHPGLGLGIEVPSVVDALRAELPGVEVVLRAGLRGAGRGPLRLRRRGRGGPRRPTCAWPSSVTWPACSATARPARAATPRTCGCPACRPTCSTSCWPPGRRWSWSWSPAARTRWATCTAAPPASCRRSCRARRAARRSPACCPAGSSPAASCRCRSRGGPGGQPGTYLQPPLGARRAPASAASTRRPLFPFGYGASYTTFEVDDLRISAAEVPTDGEFTVTVRVRNTGARAGDEVVQLYLHDVLAQVTRPVTAADRLRPGPAGAGRGRGRAVPACTPTGPRSPAGT